MAKVVLLFLFFDGGLVTGCWAICVVSVVACLLAWGEVFVGLG